MGIIIHDMTSGDRLTPDEWRDLFEGEPEDMTILGWSYPESIWVRDWEAKGTTGFSASDLDDMEIDGAPLDDMCLHHALIACAESDGAYVFVLDEGAGDEREGVYWMTRIYEEDDHAAAD
jgi:hypothetical protein